VYLYNGIAYSTLEQARAQAQRDREAAAAARQCNEAIERYNTATHLSGQAQIDRRNEAIDALDDALDASIASFGLSFLEFYGSRRIMVAQRDREVIALREAAAAARERDTENKLAAVRALLENSQQKLTARDIDGAKIKCREAEAELQKGELRYQAGDLLRNQLREQSERILAAERVIAQEATLRIHNQAQGFAAEAAGLNTEAARLSGQAKITKLNEAKTAYDRAIVLNTVNKAAYQASQRAIIAQRDREVIALQQENQRKVNEADSLYREGLRLKAQNTEQSLQSAVEKFRAAARITVISEYRALYQREDAAATAAIPAAREAAARERDTENKRAAVRAVSFIRKLTTKTYC